jgi:folate-dependent phosphoribosylglycinamide formyltransferase PurN
MQTRTTSVDIKTVQSYSLYEKHRESREQRENIEYEKIQNEHIKCCEIARMSQSIRERIISTYRAEIESHRYLEGDFSGLRALVDDLKRRKEAMDISINALQGDYES